MTKIKNRQGDGAGPVLLAVGTRPEAIKMAPLLPALRAEGLDPCLLTTGQHAALLDRALASLGISPDRRLPYRTSREGLAARAGRLILRLARELAEIRPRILLAHGDTLSAYAAATAAFLSGIPVGHVEAGLRTECLRDPYPEEFCRREIDALADVLYAPTEAAARALLAEGHSEERIAVTGNTGLDALRMTVRADFSHPLLRKCGGRRLLLLTLHRRETQGAPLLGILSAVLRAVDAFPDVFLLFPHHPSAAIATPARRLLGAHPRIAVRTALDPIAFQNLLARAYLVITDSGGIQEEAAYLHRPTLVVRRHTERGEGVATGALRLVGTDPQAVYEGIAELLSTPALHAAMAAAENPFGDGCAATRIAKDLHRRLASGRV